MIRLIRAKGIGFTRSRTSSNFWRQQSTKNQLTKHGVSDVARSYLDADGLEFRMQQREKWEVLSQHSMKGRTWSSNLSYSARFPGYLLLVSGCRRSWLKKQARLIIAQLATTASPWMVGCGDCEEEPQMNSQLPCSEEYEKQMGGRHKYYNHTSKRNTDLPR